MKDAAWFRQELRLRYVRQRRVRSVLNLTVLFALMGLATGTLLFSIGPNALAEILVRFSTDSAPCLIKGDITVAGDRFYHLPSNSQYDEVMISTRRGERWFCSESEALAEGWRRARN